MFDYNKNKINIFTIRYPLYQHNKLSEFLKKFYNVDNIECYTNINMLNRKLSTMNIGDILIFNNIKIDIINYYFLNQHDINIIKLQRFNENIIITNNKMFNILYLEKKYKNKKRELIINKLLKNG